MSPTGLPADASSEPISPGIADPITSSTTDAPSTITDAANTPAAADPTTVGTVTTATTGSVSASPSPPLADVLTSVQSTLSQLASDLAALGRITDDLAALAAAAPRIDAAINQLQAVLK